ncbi:MAG: hypothetical protein JO326_02570, partial [Acetobacteraceae bacterium]|nr:hypothetical protein [Acetobacteraceae bacterium]
FLRRFDAYYARYQAGTLGPPRPRRPRVAPAVAPASAEATAPETQTVSATRPARVRLRLPGEFGWVAKCGIAASNAECLKVMLQEPEVQAMLALAPQMARLFTPLCHAFGLRYQEGLPRIVFPERKPRPRKPRPECPADAGSASRRRRKRGWVFDASKVVRLGPDGRPDKERAVYWVRDPKTRKRIPLIPGFAGRDCWRNEDEE